MEWARFDDGTLMSDPPLPPVDDSPPGKPEETRGPAPVSPPAVVA